MSTTAERIDALKTDLQKMATVRSGSFNWKFLGRPTKGGHKYFLDLDRKEIAVADNSGRTPDQTEDGVLWLDRTRPVNVEVSRSGYAAGDVPVVDRVGRKSWVPGTAADAAWLKANHRMTVKFGPKAQLIRDI